MPMYSVKKCNTVDTARSNISHKIFSTRKDSEKLVKKIRGFDSCTIPPCFKLLKQKILRTIFVIAMMKNAAEKQCITLDPPKCGWEMKDILEPFWFEDDATPLSVDDILKNNRPETRN
uniref:Uncharacterized protein n=1 Tax=Photinus pyralis TaxID=7054 RepID=A0A1Y1M5W5_PHOPY